MDITEYINLLKKRRKKLRFFVVYPQIILFIVATILVVLVSLGPKVGIPKASSEYMGKTQFWNFSVSELEDTLVDKSILSKLVLIYNTSIISSLILAILFFGYGFLRGMGGKKTITTKAYWRYQI